MSPLKSPPVGHIAQDAPRSLFQGRTDVNPSQEERLFWGHPGPSGRQSSRSAGRKEGRPGEKKNSFFLQEVQGRRAGGYNRICNRQGETQMDENYGLKEIVRDGIGGLVLLGGFLLGTVFLFSS